MYLLQRTQCMFGSHRRSRGSVQHFPDTMRSVCRGCGTPMIRDAVGWRLDRDPIPMMPPSPFA